MPLKQFDPQTKKKRIIAVAAGKGGVGKSTVALNLALALQRRGLRIALLDADLYGPSLRRMLPEGVLPKQNGPTLLPAETVGIKFLSMAFFQRDDEATAVRAPIANRLIQQMVTQVDWGEPDLLIIDFPPGTGDIHLTLAQNVLFDGALMITTPQELACADVRKAMELFDRVDIPLIGIVENMSYWQNPSSHELFEPFGRGGGERLAAEKGIPLLARIPIDPLLSESADSNALLFDLEKQHPSPAANAFRQLTRDFLEALDKISTPLPPPRCAQIDARTLGLAWEGTPQIALTAQTIQANCPCAGCSKKAHTPSSDVAFTSIERVGRYALRFQFSEGCSDGIYTFKSLQSLTPPQK